MFTVGESPPNISGKKREQQTQQQWIQQVAGNPRWGKIYKQNSATARTSTFNSARVTAQRRETLQLETEVIQRPRICRVSNKILQLHCKRSRRREGTPTAALGICFLPGPRIRREILPKNRHVRQLFIYLKVRFYSAYYNLFLLYRHECFTEKYTTRKIHKNYIRDPSGLFSIILLHEKLLIFDWLRAVVFQLNLKCLQVKITNLLRVVIQTNNSMICT